jgi:hypothetical protein
VKPLPLPKQIVPKKEVLMQNGGSGSAAARCPPRRKRTGRRSLYIPELVKRICKLLEKGNTIVAAMEHCGLSESVYYDWCERHEQFQQATSRARGKARVALVKIINDAAKTDWRAAAWKLSHIWPNEYSETSRLAIDARHVGVILLPQKEDKEP